MSLFNKALKPKRIQPSAVIAPGGDPITGEEPPCKFNRFSASLNFRKGPRKKTKR